MPRFIPPCPLKAPTAANPWLIERQLEIRLVTPMFGGGVMVGEFDPITPIRASSIRGHLRFWWRLTRGAVCRTPEELREREAEIWGSPENASPVSVEVSHVSQQQERRGPDYDFPKYGSEAYALFSAKQNEVPALCKEGLTFQVRLTWPNQAQLQRLRDRENAGRRAAGEELLPPEIRDISPDLEAALWAWLNFGGLGGRTRRGCGSLYCTELPKQLTLPARTRLFLGKPCKDALQAWRGAVDVYQRFRQFFRGPRHPKNLRSGNTVPVPGRSHWPEPDSIRHITGCALQPRAGTPPLGVPPDIDTQDHSTPVVPAGILPSFPRAVLGLPIGFHFADGPGKGKPAKRHLDPADVELRPDLGRTATGKVEGSRMASPVITKALFFQGSWVPAVLLLPHDHALAVAAVLEGKQALPPGNPLSRIVPNSQIVGPQQGRLTPMAGHGNAIEALIDFLGRTTDGQGNPKEVFREEHG